MLTMSRMTDHIIKHVLVESQRTWYESFSVESGNKKKIPIQIIFKQKFGCIYTSYIYYLHLLYLSRSYHIYNENKMSKMRGNMMVFKSIKVKVNVNV